MRDDDEKRGLRRRARLARGERTDGASVQGWARSLLALPELTDARVVAAYTAYGNEPPLAPVLRRLLARGVRVLLPVLRPDHDLDWVDVSDLPRLPSTVLRTGDPVLRTVEVRADLLAEADAVVVPALLVGLDGARLGQGGGSYDRALGRARREAPVVAVVHDDELRPAGEIPLEEHDRRVTHAATPTRLLDLRDGGRAEPLR